MNKLKKIFPIISLFIIIYIIFKYNYILTEATIKATNLWLKHVFPPLFIMFILNDLIINLNILKPINNLISPYFNKLFLTSSNSFQAFILSIFSGTPSSAFIIKEMLNKGNITLNDANKLISFTYFSNPLFLYSILSLSFNKFITIKIILVHYLTNILIGILFRKDQGNNQNIYKSIDKNENLFLILPKSITKSFNTLLMILGTITFYMIITNFILTIFNIHPLMQVICQGFLEITQSLNNLPLLNYISIIKEIIALVIISFGGMSIHTQVLQILNGTKIKYKNFLYGRILHALISAITYICLYIFIG